MWTVLLKRSSLVVSSQNIPYAILHGKIKITFCIGYWWWQGGLFLRFQTRQIPKQKSMDFLRLSGHLLFCVATFPDVQADRALQSAADWQLDGAEKKTAHAWCPRSFKPNTSEIIHRLQWPFETKVKKPPPCTKKGLQYSSKNKGGKEKNLKIVLFVAFLRLRSHCLSGGCGGPWCLVALPPEYVTNDFVESNVQGVQSHSSARMLSNAKLIKGQHSGPAWQLHIYRTGELVYSRSIQTWRYLAWRPQAWTQKGGWQELLCTRVRDPVWCTNSGMGSSPTGPKNLGSDIFWRITGLLPSSTNGAPCCQGQSKVM